MTHYAYQQVLYDNIIQVIPNTTMPIILGWEFLLFLLWPTLAIFSLGLEAFNFGVGLREEKSPLYHARTGHQEEGASTSPHHVKNL